MKKVRFLEKHELGAASGNVKRIVKPGADALVTNNQAALLARKKIAVVVEEEKKAEPVDRKKREEFVRYRLEKKEKPAILAKLERLKVKVPKGVDKPGLIDLYVAEIDPGPKPKANAKSENGEGQKGG